MRMRGKIVVEPELEQLLGIPAAKIRRMSLVQLSDAAYALGLTWSVSTKKTDEADGEGRLILGVERDALQVQR